MPPVSPTPRLVLIGVLWTVLAVMLITFGTMPEMSDGAISISIAAVIGATFVSMGLLRGIGTPPMVDQHAAAVRKRKNEESRAADPMSLLTDEDIEELRAEMKDRLRRRMLEGDGEEPASFEALLTEREQRKRHK